MVSSTYTDLTAHREAVCDALLRLGFFPLGMEYDSAKAGKDIINSSMEMVSNAQAYIGIISHRYGGVPQDAKRNPEQLSITELEYRTALKRRIPVFIFLMSDDHPVKRQDVEPLEAYQDKLRRLKADAQSRTICATFSSVEELKSQVLQSMFELRAQLSVEEEPVGKRAQGKRALAESEPPHLLAIPNFISGHEFVGRQEEIAWLNEWATDSDPLLVIEAIGGAGKSTLAWQWLTEQATIARPNFAGRLWFSFYEGGADMTSFAAHALAYVTRQPLSDFRGRKTAELAVMLISALREEPFLLVLDGLERVLVAYHRLDASQARDDEVASGKDDRACIKPADSDLLRQLVAASPSKILITSRLMPTALLNRSGDLLPHVRHRFLGGLHRDDALKMMRAVGVKGDAETIQHYLSENFDNHPQIVGVVAGLVKDYVREPGNFDRWAVDPQAGAALQLSKLDLVQRQTHILATALGGLEPGARQVLSRIAALGYAVGFETVEALNPFMPPPPERQRSKSIPLWLGSNNSVFRRVLSWAKRLPASDENDDYLIRLEQYHKAEEEREAAYLRAVEEYQKSEEVQQALPRLISALDDLEKRGLLQWDRQNNSYDLHPVVRGYAFDVLEQSERVDICDSIADHFRSKPKDRYGETRTVADVQQSMNIFRALVQAGRFDQAINFYRGDFANALSYSIEAYHEILALLKPFFPGGFAYPPLGCSRTSDESYLLNNAAVALIELGRLPEARAALTAKLPLNLRERDWQNIRICLTNMGETYRDENKLSQAHDAFELAFELAQATIIFEDMARCQWYLMGLYRIIGQLEKAQAACDAFSRRPISTNRAIYRAGEIESELCWLSFYRGVLTVEQLDDADAVARSGNSRTILRSLAHLRGELALERDDMALAGAAFESAIEMGQAVGLAVGHFEARLALVKARVGERAQSRELCDRLHELEKPPHLELAPAYLELGEVERAREHALQGYSEAWADGPPYSRWWDLAQCRDVLKALGVSEPQLPPFNPEAAEPLPYEAEIRAAIARLKK
ncbi:MAG: DUF4062 domain-containing protein [Acidobacteria bacterium]|nr:DUF4062 domain-containing protein [Acidobacteriota bacterium]